MPSLVEYLHNFVRTARVDEPALQHELRQIEARKQEIQTQLDTARLAAQRASSFIAGSGLDSYCPRCWILHEKMSTLRTVPSDRPRVDLYRCNSCDFEYEVEV